MQETSWHQVGSWYNSLVGRDGHYYHEHVIFPKLRELLKINPGEHILELGCGQGVYARTLEKGVNYLGLDLGKSLIEEAKKLDHDHAHKYRVADVTRELSVATRSFDHVVSILALQNMEQAELAIKNAGKAVKRGGDFVMVLNHPAFRIPRQSSWGIDPQNKLEYRRLNLYLSPLRVPITTHPGKDSSPVTWSYHAPISFYFSALKQAGFMVTDLEEWVSDKESKGKGGKAENRARRQFPLFLALRAISA